MRQNFKANFHQNKEKIIDLLESIYDQTEVIHEPEQTRVYAIEGNHKFMVLQLVDSQNSWVTYDLDCKLHSYFDLPAIFRPRQLFWFENGQEISRVSNIKFRFEFEFLTFDIENNIPIANQELKSIDRDDRIEFIDIREPKKSFEFGISPDQKLKSINKDEIIDVRKPKKQFQFGISPDKEGIQFTKLSDQEFARLSTKKRSKISEEGNRTSRFRPEQVNNPMQFLGFGGQSVLERDVPENISFCFGSPKQTSSKTKNVTFSFGSNE